LLFSAPSFGFIIKYTRAHACTSFQKRFLSFGAKQKSPLPYSYTLVGKLGFSSAMLRVNSPGSQPRPPYLSVGHRGQC